MVCRYFHSVGCLFILPVIPFAVKSLFSLMQSHRVAFASVVCAPLVLCPWFPLSP